TMTDPSIYEGPCAKAVPKPQKMWLANFVPNRIESDSFLSKWRRWTVFVNLAPNPWNVGDEYCNMFEGQFSLITAGRITGRAAEFQAAESWGTIHPVESSPSQTSQRSARCPATDEPSFLVPPHLPPAC
ncbi:MAG: hypothetical protein ACYC6N_02675, partial [Pirellulaceae bacterium]